MCKVNVVFHFFLSRFYFVSFIFSSSCFYSLISSSPAFLYFPHLHAFLQLLPFIPYFSCSKSLTQTLKNKLYFSLHHPVWTDPAACGFFHGTHEHCHLPDPAQCQPQHCNSSWWDLPPSCCSGQPVGHYQDLVEKWSHRGRQSSGRLSWGRFFYFLDAGNWWLFKMLM